MKTPLLEPKESSSSMKWLMVALICSLCVLGAVTHGLQQEEAVGSVPPDPEVMGDARAEAKLSEDPAVVAVPAVADAKKSPPDLSELEVINCMLMDTRRFDLAEDADVEGCTSVDCSNPVLKGVTCDPLYSTSGVPVVAGGCTIKAPYVELTGCNGNPCVIPEQIPQGYMLIDHTKPATLSDCTSSMCRKGVLTNIQCSPGYVLNEYLTAPAPYWCRLEDTDLRIRGCDPRRHFDSSLPIKVTPPVNACRYQDSTAFADRREYATPCLCGNVAAGGNAVMCDFENSLCTVDKNHNGMCTHLCARNSDCGKMTCDFSHEIENFTEGGRKFKLGRCVSKSTNQIVDYRTENPVIVLHKSVTPENTAGFEKALNLHPDTWASDVPPGTIYLYVWAKHQSNPGHVSLLYNAGEKAKYMSHWPAWIPDREFPRHDIRGEHMLPDVIYKLENVVFNQKKLAEQENAIETRTFKMSDENCSWAVKKILHATDFPVQRYRGWFPWTPWIIMKTVNAAFKHNKRVREKFNIKRFMRPDMSHYYWNRKVNTWTDPHTNVFTLIGEWLERKTG